MTLTARWAMTVLILSDAPAGPYFLPFPGPTRPWIALDHPPGHPLYRTLHRPSPVHWPEIAGSRAMAIALAHSLS